MPRVPLPLAGALLALGFAVTACERRDEIATRDVEREVPPATVPQPAPAAPVATTSVGSPPPPASAPAKGAAKEGA